MRVEVSKMREVSKVREVGEVSEPKRRQSCSTRMRV